jgi:formamidase
VAEEGTAMEKTLCGCLATRPLAVSDLHLSEKSFVTSSRSYSNGFCQCLPEPKGAMLGKLGHFLDMSGNCEVWDKIASEGARTVPGRENGGNCDIKNLSRGCTVWFPVFVPGALLSMGDMHMSQGDGEVSFCGAIEMAGK